MNGSRTLGRFGVAALASQLCLACAGPAFARGGGGCLEEGTPVLTPAGAVPIERLVAGHRVWSVTAGRLQEADVLACTRVTPAQFIEILHEGGTLRLTPEHPVQTGAGVFRRAADLRPGQNICLARNVALTTGRILSIRRIEASRDAYNLLVSPGGTYVADGVVVHNKGCFLPDTPIRTADEGDIAIREVKIGDRLLAFEPEGRIVTVVVRNILRHRVKAYFVVRTQLAALRVTAEHPFYTGGGEFRTVEALRIGDRVYAFDGSGLSPQSITAIERVARTVEVYNLQTDAPHTYFAAGIAVHNKGGGGFGRGFSGGGRSSSFYGGHGTFYHGSYRNNNPTSAPAADENGKLFFFLIVFVIVGLFLLKAILSNRKGRRGNLCPSRKLNYLYCSSEAKPKVEQTRKLLDFISRTDKCMDEKALVQFARETFVKLQECWQNRDYGPMKPLMMSDLYEQHCQQIASMIRNHEINIIADLAVERVEIVHVRYTTAEKDRQFTALFTASAKDYYFDDRTKEYLRGDMFSARFQEFWTFHRMDGAWRVGEIEQTAESDVLKEENFFEPFTDRAVASVAGDPVAGPAGPWLEKDVQSKSARTDRLLNFLSQTDKLWSRPLMMERAREIFLKVYMARESGDASAVREMLFPGIAQSLGLALEKLRGEHITIEYRNLCLRKVELLLIRNFNDNTKDEFTVRISAHAQSVRKQDGRVTDQDDDVTTFVEYWTLGRLDRQWKLKEILPPAASENLIRQENVDEGTPPGQMQWFYRQTRA